MHAKPRPLFHTCLDNFNDPSPFAQLADPSFVTSAQQVEARAIAGRIPQVESNPFLIGRVEGNPEMFRSECVGVSQFYDLAIDLRSIAPKG
jgi:hypothetical protein